MDITGGEVDKSAIERSINEELQLLQKAKHDNIANVFGWSKWKFGMGLVMEYYRGGNLRQLLLDHRVDVGVLLRIRILAESAKGVVFIHNLSNRRLVHGDLKPDNILLTEDLHCKIADFGSAEIVRMTSTATRIAGDGTGKQFTLEYAAPERLQKMGGKLKQEHDTYSFALIIHMVLSRVPPYHVGDPIYNAVINGQRPTCEEIQIWKANLTPDEIRLAEEMETMMEESWDQNPAHRPHMTQVNERLQQIYERQDQVQVTRQVSKAQESMQQTVPSRNCWQELSKFSPREGEFTDIPRTVRLGTGNFTLPQLSVVVSLLVLLFSIAIPVAFWTMQGFSENEGSHLVHQYVQHVKSEQYNEAKEVKTKISKKMLEKNDTLGAWDLAEKYRNNEKHLEAILYYKISSECIANLTPIQAADRIKECAWGIMESNKGMVELDKLNSGGNVTINNTILNYVVPSIKSMKERIENITLKNSASQILLQAWCLHYIEWCQYLAGNFTEMKKTCFEGIQLMKIKFGEDAGRHQVYAHLLNNFGIALVETNEQEKAIEYTKLAMNAYKTSMDYSNPKENAVKVMEKRLKQMENAGQN